MKRALLLVGWLVLSAFDFGYKVGAPKYRDNIVAVYHGDVNIGHYHLIVDTASGFKVTIREVESDDNNGGCQTGSQPVSNGYGAHGCITPGSGLTISQDSASSEMDFDMSELDAIADALKYFKHKMELVQAAKVEDK